MSDPSMVEVKVGCTKCGAHFLIEESYVDSPDLACPTCGGKEFVCLPKADAVAPAPVAAPEPVAVPEPVVVEPDPVEPKSVPAEPKTAAVPLSKSGSPKKKEPSRDDLKSIKVLYDRVVAELGKVIVGQEAVIEELLVAILSGGHCLLEGVPGLAKTLLIQSLSEAMDLSFKRIQFTPDLMPTDITGTEIIQEDPVTGERKFKFMRGPIFANIVLADEINRTPPKTQAALLEAMQERQVSIGGTVHPMAKPFFILATQNPLEQEGTYPLPEAQQDRFLFKIFVDYPSHDEETEIVRRVSQRNFGKIDAICDGETLLAMQKTIREIPVADAVIDYANTFVRATRVGRDTALDFVNDWLSWGAGPRATINLISSAKCFGALAGSPTPSCDDVVRAALPVMRHRLALNYTGKAEGLTTDSVIQKIIETIPKY